MFVLLAIAPTQFTLRNSTFIAHLALPLHAQDFLVAELMPVLFIHRQLTTVANHALLQIWTCSFRAADYVFDQFATYCHAVISRTRPCSRLPKFSAWWVFA